MNLRWMAIFCLVTLPILASAQEESTPPAPPRNSAASAPAPKQSTPDYSQEPFVIEQYNTSVRNENDGTGERDVTARILVQSDAGVQQLGQLVFGYSSANEQMDVRYVRVRKPDGSVVTAGPDAITDLTAPVARDAPSTPTSRRNTSRFPISLPESRSNTKSIRASSRRSLPANSGSTTISSRARSLSTTASKSAFPKDENRSPVIAQTPYDTVTKDGRTIYTWKHSNLILSSDDESQKQKPQNAEAQVPDVQLTTFTSWEAVGRWYAKLEQGRTDPSPEIRAKTAALILGRMTELEKIQALYDYVSKNIRYVSLSFGVGRYQPHTAAEVFANQYGDCKDKHTLLASMLEAAGIPSDAVLISYERKFDPSMPSPAQFNHMITAVPLGKELIWMDATEEVAPFRLLASPLRDKSALVVPPDGDAKVVETPADPPFPSSQHR